MQDVDGGRRQGRTSTRAQDLEARKKGWPAGLGCMWALGPLLGPEDRVRP